MNHTQKLDPRQRQLVEENISIVRWVIYDSIYTNSSICGLEYNDLFQEGCLWLCKAALSFDASRAAFPAFAKSVVRNGLITHCKAIQRHESLICRPTFTYEGTFEDEAAAFAAWKTTMDQIEIQNVLDSVKLRYHGITRRGIEAIALRAQGKSMRQIASSYHVPDTHICAWVSRAAKKLRQDREFLSAFQPPAIK